MLQRSYVDSASVTPWSITDWLGLLSDIATTIGIPIALIGGIIAYRSYRASRDIAASVHMHGLFRDYLRMRMDYDIGDMQRRSTATPCADDAALLALASAKLYVLEEMWLWIEQQRRTFSLGRHEKRMQLRSWEATILSHVLDDPAETLRLLLDFTSCYSASFLAFVAKHVKNEELKEAAEAAVAADASGVARGLGHKEYAQRELAEEYVLPAMSTGPAAPLPPLPNGAAGGTRHANGAVAPAPPDAAPLPSP